MSLRLRPLVSCRWIRDFGALSEVLNLLDRPEIWPLAYLNWELALLDEMRERFGAAPTKFDVEDLYPLTARLLLGGGCCPPASTMPAGPNHTIDRPCSWQQEVQCLRSQIRQMQQIEQVH